MYDVRFSNGRSSLVMTPTNGYYVETIDGLTGITANFETVKAISGYGEAVAYKTIQAKPLTVRGYVLDTNTTAKQNLLNFMQAGAELVMTIYKTENDGGVARATPYRQATVFVKQSPVISQKAHSSFIFTLYMPNPYWEDTTAREFSVQTGASATPQEILGDVPPEFTFRYTASADSLGASLYADPVSATGQMLYLYLDYSKIEGGYLPAGKSVIVRRVNGRLTVTMAEGNLPAGESIIEAAYTNSTLWYLPIGSNYSYALQADGGFTNAKISYRPLYSGVLVDGV